MNGDLVNRGPDSLGCLRLFLSLQHERSWIPLRGNHEDFVLHCGRAPATTELDRELRRFADWTAAQLGVEIREFDSWADHLCLQGPGRSWVHCTHGTMLGNRDGISASLPDEALAERLPQDTPLFVTAHTHKPLERIYRGTRILNVGSVGSPFDGDPRASYGRIEYRNGSWRTRIVRFSYDRERTDREFRDSGFLDQGGPLARVIYQEWRRAQLLMPHWQRAYLERVKERDITLNDAVQAFLRDLD